METGACAPDSKVVRDALREWDNQSSLWFSLCRRISSLVPVKAGTQELCAKLDSRSRGKERKLKSPAKSRNPLLLRHGIESGGVIHRLRKCGESAASPHDTG